MSTILDRLERHIAAMDLYQKNRTGGELLIASRDELRRLEKENAAMKSTLIEIRDLCQRTCYSFEDQSFASNPARAGGLCLMGWPLHQSPIELINYIQQEKIKLPVNIKCGNCTFIITNANINGVRLGCLMASSWGDDS